MERMNVELKRDIKAKKFSKLSRTKQALRRWRRKQDNRDTRNLLDKFIEAVVRECEIDGLPMCHGELPDVRVYVPEKRMEPLKNELTRIMKEYAHDEVAPSLKRLMFDD